MNGTEWLERQPDLILPHECTWGAKMTRRGCQAWVREIESRHARYSWPDEDSESKSGGEKLQECRRCKYRAKAPATNSKPHPWTRYIRGKQLDAKKRTEFTKPARRDGE